MTKKIILLSITFFTLAVLTPAQNNFSFEEALNHFKKAEYAEALRILSIVEKSDSSKLTAIKLFKIKSLFKIKEFTEARIQAEDFLMNFPGSKYADEVKAIIINIDLSLKNYIGAAQKSLKLLSSTKENYYKNFAEDTFEIIALNKLPAIQVLSLLDTVNENIKPFALLSLSKLYLNNNDKISAIKSLEDLIKNYPSSDKVDEAKRLQKIAGEENRPIKNKRILGVMLPLNNKSVSSAVLDILEGIRFAVDEYNSANDEMIGILVRDTKRDSEQIEQIKNEFDEYSSLSAIIGPLFSDEVNYALEAFSNSSIPIISPTATENNLTQKYKYFFQANPSFELRGKLMAEYIYYVENKTRLAVLNANSGYSVNIADAFVNQFKKLGGQIFARASYQTNTFSMIEQISAFDTFADTLQGIYIPLVDKIDAPVILSNMVQDTNLVREEYNFSIYGNQDWLEAKSFETSTKLSNNLTFTSDYFLDYNDENFRNFSYRFSKKTGKDANRNVLYGYDVTVYLLKSLNDANQNHRTLVDELQSGITYVGLHGNIAFDKNRINKFLNIIRYKNGIFQLVDRFKASE